MSERETQAVERRIPRAVCSTGSLQRDWRETEGFFRRKIPTPGNIRHGGYAAGHLEPRDRARDAIDEIAENTAQAVDN